jgi:hypothetical protein
LSAIGEINVTPKELESFRMKMQLEALRVLVQGLYSALANSSPEASANLRERFAELRRSHGQVVIKGVDPAYSDMLAAEYQSALEDLLSSIEEKLRS